MTQDEKYKIARWAMEHALEKGAAEVSVSISESKSSNVDVREQKIDTLKEAIQSNLNIRLFVDKKYSSHTTNRLHKKELARFIEEAIAGTRFLSEDPFRSLPEPGLYYKGNGPALEIIDSTYDQLDPAKKIELAFQVEKEAYQKDPRVISVTAGYNDYTGNRILMNSNGFEGETGNSSFGLYASVSVDGGLARPSDSWSERSLFFDKLKTSEIASVALARALKKIGQEKISSGKYEMIVENRVCSRLFGPLLDALNGYNIQQKNSFLIGKTGEQIGSEMLDLTDDPLIVSGNASRLFDNEGLEAKKRSVFEKGVLKTYFIDTYYGKKLKMEPTTGSTSNLVLTPGSQALNEMISTVKNGILVTGFNGGNTNGSTGDFSYGIDGFLIENGQVVKPVSEMNISGNMNTFWKELAAVGNDPDLNTSWRIPSLLFTNIDFSGI
ncbi:MAG: TldD/PmbA family protein [Prolixibacteraceae bacterium]